MMSALHRTHNRNGKLSPSQCMTNCLVSCVIQLHTQQNYRVDHMVLLSIELHTQQNYRVDHVVPLSIAINCIHVDINHAWIG